MSIPTVQNCCFCFPLRIGGLILGWLGVLSAFSEFYHAFQMPLAFMIYTIVCHLIQLISCIFLLVGIYKLNAIYIKQFLYVWVVLVIMFTIEFILVLWIIAENSIEKQLGVFILELTVMLLVILGKILTFLNQRLKMCFSSFLRLYLALNLHSLWKSLPRRTSLTFLSVLKSK